VVDFGQGAQSRPGQSYRAVSGAGRAVRRYADIRECIGLTQRGLRENHGETKPNFCIASQEPETGRASALPRSLRVRVGCLPTGGSHGCSPWFRAGDGDVRVLFRNLCGRRPRDWEASYTESKPVVLVTPPCAAARELALAEQQAKQVVNLARFPKFETSPTPRYRRCMTRSPPDLAKYGSPFVYPTSGGCFTSTNCRVRCAPRSHGVRSSENAATRLCT
jgi:hypothetical protein